MDKLNLGTDLGRRLAESVAEDLDLNETQSAGFAPWLERQRLYVLDRETVVHRPQQGSRPPGVEDLRELLTVWWLSKAEAGRIFGVSRQAVGKWLHSGMPADRLPAIATLGAATDILLRYLKAERIPAVVRRSAVARGDRSLIEVATEDGADAVLAACRAMFDFAAANGALGDSFESSFA